MYWRVYACGEEGGGEESFREAVYGLGLELGYPDVCASL